MVEQSHDEHGIIWPLSIAPYHVHLVGAEGRGGDRRAGGRSRSTRQGSRSSSTTATCGPGEKFADADLIGIPFRVTAGKKSLEDAAVDVRNRATGDERRVNVAELGENLVDGYTAQGYASEPFGPAVERLMNETGVTYRALAAKTSSRRGT